MRCTSVKSKKPFAVKIMSLSHDASQEIKALVECQGHENIVKHIENMVDEEFRYIVFELLSGGELFSRIQNSNHLSEAVARSLFLQLVSAVQFMHNKKFVHCDLKPENVMFVGDHEDSQLKIVDFGFAKRRTSKESPPCFTLDYAAPESLIRGPTKESRDLWALGVMLYTMLCGITPFKPRDFNKQREEKNRILITDNIRNGHFSMTEQWETLSPSAKDLIKKLLKVEPSKRLTLDQVIGHEWFAHKEPESKEPESKTINRETENEIDLEPITVNDDDDSVDVLITKVQENRDSNDSSGIYINQDNVGGSSISSHVEDVDEPIIGDAYEPVVEDIEEPVEAVHETVLEDIDAKISQIEIQEEIKAPPEPEILEESPPEVEEKPKVELKFSIVKVEAIQEPFGDAIKAPAVFKRGRGRPRKIKQQPITYSDDRTESIPVTEDLIRSCSRSSQLEPCHGFGGIESTDIGLWENGVFSYLTMLEFSPPTRKLRKRNSRVDYKPPRMYSENRMIQIKSGEFVEEPEDDLMQLNNPEFDATPLESSEHAGQFIITELKEEPPKKRARGRPRKNPVKIEKVEAEQVPSISITIVKPERKRKRSAENPDAIQPTAKKIRKRRAEVSGENPPKRRKGRPKLEPAQIQAIIVQKVKVEAQAATPTKKRGRPPKPKATPAPTSAGPVLDGSTSPVFHLRRPRHTNKTSLIQERHIYWYPGQLDEAARGSLHM